MGEGKKKELCFNYTNKWHNCKTQKLLMEGVQSVPKEQAESFSEEYIQEIVVAPQEEQGAEISEISLHALIENPSPQAMRILGQIKGQWVVILIDMGNTHNFWDSSNLSKMHLPLSTGQGFETKID